MCRDKSHGGRRCPSANSEVRKEVSTIDRQVQRLKRLLDVEPSANRRNAIEREIAKNLAEREEKLRPPVEIVDTSEEASEVRTTLATLFTRLAEQKERTERRAVTAQRDEDEHSKLDPLPFRVRKVKVYRSGVVKAPETRGVEAQAYLDADQHCPDGRVGRTQGIFASPTMSGVTRWFRGNYNTFASQGVDVQVREIEVDPDEVYVYSVKAWEDASWGRYAETPKAYQAFWESGMTLREWYDRGINDGDNWELLLSPQHVQSVKPVGQQRLLNNTDERDRDQIESVFAGLRRNRTITPDPVYPIAE